MPERLEVWVRGKVLAGWQAVEVSRAIDQASGSFAIQAPTRAPFPLAPGDPAEVYVGTQRLIAGHVDQVERSLGDRRRDAQIQGRDLTADLVDCSAADEPSEWTNIQLEDLVREIAKPYGVEVHYTAGQKRVFETYRKRPGDTAWALIERACRMRGVLVYSDGNGRLILRQAGPSLADVELLEGGNIRSAIFSSDSTDRFRLYVVHGQRQGTDSFTDEAVALVEGSATDAGAREGRRLVVIAEATVTNQTAAERAQWEATVRAARAVRVQVTVNGWRQEGVVGVGRLWEVNEQVAVRAPSLDLDGYLLIQGVTFVQNQGQEFTQLDLVRADAYKPQPDLPAEEDLMQEWLRGASAAEDEPDDPIHEDQ